ncbi:MAG: hypothetical protein AAGF30_16370 [Pseudomonadota bacterium]
MRFLALFLIVLLPEIACAGAWPRAQGETFVLVSHDFDDWTSVYVEHGGPRNLTFGLDLGGHVVAGMAALSRNNLEELEIDGRAIAFVRLPLPLGRDYAGPWRYALELGAGADFDMDFDTGETEPRARIGLSAGRGFETPLGGGWFNVDLRVEPGAGPTRVGIGAVAGIRPLKRLTTSLGVFIEDEEETFVTFAPNLAYEVPILGEAQFGFRLTDGDGRFVIGIGRTF